MRDDIGRWTLGDRGSPLVPRGMYRYMADAGGVAECVTRRRRPVAEAEDHPVFDAH